MKNKTLLRLVAVFFMCVGWFLTRTANSDPAPRNTWVTHKGALMDAKFIDSQKLGRIATLTIDNAGGEPAFMLSHIQKLPDFERQILALPPRATIEIDAVPRELAGWAAPEGKPLTMLILRHGETVIYDRDRDARGGQWISKAVTIAGYSVAGLFFLVFLLSFKPKPRRNV